MNIYLNFSCPDRPPEQREREETGTPCRRRGKRICAAETCQRARRVAGEGGGAGELAEPVAPDFNAF